MREPTEVGGFPVVAYGLSCLFWQRDDERQIKSCPTCGDRVAYIAAHHWTESIEDYERFGNDGYAAMVEWGKGSCFRSAAHLREEYRKATGKIVNHLKPIYDL